MRGLWVGVLTALAVCAGAWGQTPNKAKATDQYERLRVLDDVELQYGTDADFLWDFDSASGRLKLKDTAGNLLGEWVDSGTSGQLRIRGTGAVVSAASGYAIVLTPGTLTADRVVTFGDRALDFSAGGTFADYDADLAALAGISFSTKGELIGYTGSALSKIAAPATNWDVLRALSSDAEGVVFSAPEFPSDVIRVVDPSDLTKKLAFGVASVGTGTTRTWFVPNLNMDWRGVTALAKGTIFVYDGSNIRHVGVGTDGYVLSADSAAASGVNWVAHATAGANATLSNLGTTAVNAHILPGLDSEVDIGSGTLRMLNGYFGRLRTGTGSGNLLRLQAYNTNTAAYDTFATLTAGDPPTLALASSVTAVTQGNNDNSNKVATTAYVDAKAIGLPVVDTTAIVTGSADGTKKLAFEVDGFTTGTTRTITPPDRNVILGNELIKTFELVCSNETTAITTGTGKLTFRMPHALTITGVRASLTTASTSGIPTFNIKESGTTIFSTKLTIDANEKTSETAATPAVLSDLSLADDAEITVDFDVAGTGTKGVKIKILGYRP